VMPQSRLRSAALRSSGCTVRPIGIG